MKQKAIKLPLSQKTLAELRQALAKEPAVLAAYLFGSQALGYAAQKSDFDIGLIVQDDDAVDYRQYYSQVTNAIKGKKVDVRLVAVDDFNPLFAFNVIKPNLCLYQKSEEDRVMVEKKIMKTYFDSQHMRDIYRDYLDKAFQEGSFGHAVKFNA